MSTMLYRELTAADDGNSSWLATSEDDSHLVEAGQAGSTMECFDIDPFTPFSGLPEESPEILTLRAMVVGIICGALSLVGFALLKPCSKYFGHLPILGGSFGPRENNIVQTVATAAGGMSNVFVAAFPAMYQLNLLENPQNDFWKIVTLTAVGGIFGFFFATPLRHFFIIVVARELNLIFPSLTATAVTIQSIHLASDGVISAKKKMRALAYSFCSASLLRVISQYAPGILWDWHPFVWLFLMNNGNTVALAFESWGWFIEFTPAFIGSGMLVGLNVATSFFLGGVIAWGIIGPYLVSRGLAFGMQASSHPVWSSYMTYNSLSHEFASSDHPSPRYWLLWPGLLCMIAVSFTELACQWRLLWLTSRVIWKKIVQKSRLVISSTTRVSKYEELDDVSRNMSTVEIASSSDEIIKTWMWLPGLSAIIVIACIVMKVQSGMPVVETLMALLLAFFFSFLAVQSYGATDITPLTATSKASQIVLGLENRNHGYSVKNSQTMNLIGGALASISANQASDLIGDFRIGFLLRTPLRLQWIAQGIGSLCAAIIAPTIFVLFATAYPCINDLSSQTCHFKAPSAAAWRAVAVAVTDPVFSIPTSSGIFAVAFASLGSSAVIIRHCLWTDRRDWVRAYHPNFTVMGLAFITPALHIGLAMLVGALLTRLWSKRSPQSYELYGYAIAAGLVAGEGIGGVLNAVFEILGLGGTSFSTQIGCPAGAC